MASRSSRRTAAACHTLADAGTLGERRAESRRRQADPRESGHAGDERRWRDAFLQGHARPAADRGRRGLRLVGRRQGSSARSQRVCFEIDDDVRDGHVVARAYRLDDAALEPVRLPGGWVESTISFGSNVGPRRRWRRAGRRRRPRRGRRCPPMRAASSVSSRRCCAAARAGSSSDVNVFRREFRAGHTTRNSRLLASPRAC